MSLDKTEVIDLVILRNDTVTLHLIVTEPWAANGADAMSLQAKLKNYVGFAADGQLTQQYPEARDKKIVIEIRSSYPLDDTGVRFVEAARQHWCVPEAISLLVSVVGPVF
jgi:hypothetical protein